MRNSRGLLAVGLMLMLWLSACTVTQQVADSGFRPPEGNYKLLVMQPDISVGVLTAGGAFEFREDWTEQARQNVLNHRRRPHPVPWPAGDRVQLQLRARG